MEDRRLFLSQESLNSRVHRDSLAILLCKILRAPGSFWLSCSVIQDGSPATTSMFQAAGWTKKRQRVHARYFLGKAAINGLNTLLLAIDQNLAIWPRCFKGTEKCSFYAWWSCSQWNILFVRKKGKWVMRSNQLSLLYPVWAQLL